MLHVNSLLTPGSYTQSCDIPCFTATSLPKILAPGNNTHLHCNDSNIFCSKAQAQNVGCCQELWEDLQGL